MIPALMLLAAHGAGDCPTMRLGVIGEHMTGIDLTVTFDPEPTGALSYAWTIGGTRIVGGQGTRSLRTEAALSDLVSRDHVLAGSVTIGGLPADCPAAYPFTIPMPRLDPPPDRPVPSSPK